MTRNEVEQELGVKFVDNPSLVVRGLGIELPDGTRLAVSDDLSMAPDAFEAMAVSVLKAWAVKTMAKAKADVLA